MNRRIVFLVLTIIIIVVLPFGAFSQSSITNLTFYSNSLQMNRNVQVYLPEGYNPQDSVRYPVIYFLHGAFDDHTGWFPMLPEVLDSLIGNLIISPVIIVKPDGSVGPWAGSVYTNSELYGDFEDYIVFDLVAFIDTTYKTFSVRDKRAIWGLSMGGYGSMKLALKHPDIYCGVAAHSGPLDFAHWTDWVPTILSENGGPPVSSYIPTVNNIFTYFFYTLSGAFSPNLNNAPYPVDFPLDSLGNFIDSTFNKWLLHDPARLASNITSSSDLAIYFDCGMQDELLLYPFNTGFADSLDVLGLNYVFLSYEGGHDNKLLQRFPIAISFLDSVMNLATGIFERKINLLSSFILYQNYPNPFNPITTIGFQLSAQSFVSLKVYDITGREVANLLSASLLAGSYRYEWDASDLASGVYLYKLEAGQYAEVRKMVLMK